MKKSVLVTTALLCGIALLAGLAAGCGGAKPSITSIKPSSGTGGNLAAISGTGFGKSQGSSKVMFGNTIAVVESWSETGIAVKVPSDLKAVSLNVTVTVGSTVSNGVVFKVASGGTSPSEASTPGEIEHNTPVQAMLAYLKANGQPTTGWTFSVLTVSKSDPNWKIDQGVLTGNPQAAFFLLHKVNGNWQVLAYGSDFNPQQYGAPADLKLVQPAPNPPKPNTEAQVIQSLLASKGKPTDGWQLSLLKVSKTDPNWEVIQGVRQGVTDNFLLVWNNMLGNWECLADGGPPWTGVEFKGEHVPADLNQ
jgi:hypothetical protein